MGKPDGMAPLGKLRLTRKDDIKMAHLEGARGCGMD